METNDNSYAALLRRLEESGIVDPSSSDCFALPEPEDFSLFEPTYGGFYPVSQETISPVPAKPARKKSSRKRKPLKPKVIQDSTTPLKKPDKLAQPHQPYFFDKALQSPSFRVHPPKAVSTPLRKFIYDTHLPSDLSQLVDDRVYSPKELSSILKMNEESIKYVRPLLNVPENSLITGADYRTFNEKAKYMVSLHHLLCTSRESDLSRSIPLVASYLANSDTLIHPFLQNLSSMTQPIYLVPLVTYKLVRSAFVQIDNIYDPKSFLKNETLKKQKLAEVLKGLNSRLTSDALSNIGILTSTDVNQILHYAKTTNHLLHLDSMQCESDEVVRYDAKKFIELAQTEFLQLK